MLYGQSGTGKTTLWSTFPGPILAMICSGGNRPGELRSVDTEANADRIRNIVIDNPEDIDGVCDLVSEEGEYQTLVLDHVTGLQDLVIANILGLEEIPVQRTWGMAKEQDWGQCSMQCKKYLRKMLNLPINIVIVAQERVIEPKEQDREVLKSFVTAGVIPSLAGWLNSVVDNVCQTYIRQREVWNTTKIGTKEVKTRGVTNEVDFCLRTAPSAIYASKFRIPKEKEKPQYLADPSYDKIIELIR